MVLMKYRFRFGDKILKKLYVVLQRLKMLFDDRDICILALKVVSFLFSGDRNKVFGVCISCDITQTERPTNKYSEVDQSNPFNWCDFQ